MKSFDEEADGWLYGCNVAPGLAAILVSFEGPHNPAPPRPSTSDGLPDSRTKTRMQKFKSGVTKARAGRSGGGG
jgi:hypothetical protein